MTALEDVAAQTFTAMDEALAAWRPGLVTAERGQVTTVGSGIATVTGFSDGRDGELLAFPEGLLGFAADLDEDRIGVILLGESRRLRVGAEARRTGRVVDVPVGRGLLGRVLDPAGRPLDGLGLIRAEARLPVERPAPPILARAAVSQPLATGIKVVDAAIPIGRGQRQLILGDRQTGKTTVALDAILNQRAGDVVAVYCAIGQRGSAVARAIAALRDGGALGRSVVVVAGGEDPPGLQFVAPYAAMSIAEHFMARGEDVLLVLDDLTRHARAYRELSLLLRRPPGREAYPGDIFHIHSRLLERATRLRRDRGGGSITALPIIETQAQDISAYIPTNLISITDGQVYLSPVLLRKGQMPAIDIGRSVSRVGGKAQPPALRAVAADLRLAHAQFEELETFSRFGTRLDEDTSRRLERGRRVREVLRQREHDALGVAEQVLVLLAATTGLLDPVPLPRIAEAEAALRRAAREELDAFGAHAAAGAPLTEEERARLLGIAERVLRDFHG